MAITKVTQPMFDGSMLFASNYCTGVSTGESANFQAFIDELADSRKIGILDLGVYLDTDVYFASNTTLIGTGQNFGGSLIPLNNALIAFVGNAWPSGVVQHCWIEGITIYGNQSTNENVIVVRDSYSLRFKNIRIHALDGSTNANKTGILIEGDADQRFDNLVIRGAASSPKYGVRITDGKISFNAPDIEKTFSANIQVEGGDVSITDIYMEQFSGYGIYKAADASLNIKGGHISHSGGSGFPIRVVGDNFYAAGVHYYDSTSGSNPHLISIYNPSTTNANLTRNVVIDGIPQSQVVQDANNLGLYSVKSTEVDSAGDIVAQKFSRKITCASAVATTFFSVGFGTGYVGPLRAKFSVYSQSGGNGLSVSEYMTVLSYSGSTVTNAVLTPTASVTTNLSSNWTIALTGSLSIATATVSFQATITTSGTLNSGQAEDVYAILELEGEIGVFRVTQP